jgi:hypothetical protein
LTDYFRGDEKSGITPPDLSKDVDYADHIVKARGKRTQFTSVSKASGKIRDFGDQIYRLKRPELSADDHELVEHEALMKALRLQAKNEEKAAKLKAVQALRYANMRLEGLVNWTFDINGVERKDLLTWAKGKVKPYFAKHKSP